MKKIETSSGKMKETWQNITNTGCFHTEDMRAGITVKLKGQVLVNFGGMLMTPEAIRKKNKNIVADLIPNPDRHSGVGLMLYINLGLSENSYPLMKHVANSEEEYEKGFETVDQLIYPAYTENFKLKDIMYVHFSKRRDDKLLDRIATDHVIEDTGWWFKPVEDGFNIFWDDRASPDKQNIDSGLIDIEKGIINITAIEIELGDSTIYKLGDTGEVANPETGVKTRFIHLERC